jgi:signal-transduction protein with cAMP-binding, CBS, and nucleotidyltransferase domain
MTPNPLSCTMGTTLAEVARLMWRADCGVIPVVDDSGTVTGIITDRDICIFVAAQDYPARQILAGAVATKKVHTCHPEDKALDALHTMKIHRVRRLPVVDEHGTLVGVLSLTDVALAGHRIAKGIRPLALVETYEAITERPPQPPAGEQQPQPPPGRPAHAQHV